MRGKTLVIALAFSLAACTAHGEVKSDYDRDYDFARLKTFDFKHQARSVRDPLGTNELWDRRINGELQRDLAKSGYSQADDETPDFLVAYYMGTKQWEDVRFMGYGYPGASGWRRWGWAGWSRDADVWRIPYTESTLVIDVIDATSNELVWRGYDTQTIDLGKVDRTIPHAVDRLIARFTKQVHHA